MHFHPDVSRRRQSFVKSWLTQLASNGAEMELQHVGEEQKEDQPRLRRANWRSAARGRTAERRARPSAGEVRALRLRHAPSERGRRHRLRASK